MAMDASLRARAIGLFDDEAPPSLPRRLTTVILIAAVAAMTLAAMLDTLPDLSVSGRRLLGLCADYALIVFIAEFAVRLWTAPERRTASQRSAGTARLAYLRSLFGIVDLVVIAAVLLRLSGALPADIADLVGLLALLKLGRFVPALTLILAVFRNEARSLGAALSALGVLLVIASGLMYVLEHDAQPQVFSSIPKTMWWGIVTIASVGYGDMVPVTPAGRIVGGFVILLGIALFAVPAGLLATGFAGELRKRDFVVTWQAIAKVPLFARLDAGQIADIARLLKPQVVPERYLIVHRGDAADAMYFILSGEVEVEIVPPVRLRAGQFFGEIALLRDTERTASVTAVTECHLLSLDVGDFRRLMQQYPVLEAAIRKVADSRRQP